MIGNEDKQQLAENILDLPVSMDRCTGCTACASICPKHAITMQEDKEGFISPVLHNELCVDCGLCRQVCPVLHPNKHAAPEYVHAAWIKDRNIRINKSSSGGLSYILMQNVLENGGFAVGAVNDNFYVHHEIIDHFSDIIKTAGSKYVQSDLGEVFTKVKTLLDRGERVLFTGTPCQVAGLQNFLRKEYSNLTTIDFICHGVPSPGVLRRYIMELKETYYTATYCTFRDKVNNWSAAHAFALYDDAGNTVFREYGSYNVYIRGFLHNIFDRQSCSRCLFTTKERVGDITLGDFWKSGNYKAELTDKKGTSLVFINTEKGREAFAAIKDQLAIDEEVPVKVAVEAQAQLRGPAKASPLRREFFDCYQNEGRIIYYLENKLYRVGILNFHFANNFGAVLVPFALSKIIEKLGYLPEVINYFGDNKVAANPSFEEFRTKYLVRTKRLDTKEDLIKISPWWKRIVVGSDQVWRMFDTGIYMLNWAGGKKTLISYAASFGNDTYTGRITKPEAKALLERFDAISVREASGVAICKNDFGIPAMHVLDPTLLLDAEDYVKIIDEKSDGKTTVIPEKKQLCLAILNKANVFDVNDNNILKDFRGKYVFTNALFENGKYRPIEGWLESIRKAEYVIVDSFHATVFSIIFKKQFICIVADGVNGQGRIPSLLKLLHIDMNRIYKSVSDISQVSLAVP